MNKNMRKMYTEEEIGKIAKQSSEVKLYLHYISIEYATSEQGEIQYVSAIILSTQKEPFTEITNDILLNATFINAESNDSSEYWIIFVADDLSLKAIYELNSVAYLTELYLNDTIVDFNDNVLA